MAPTDSEVTAMQAAIADLRSRVEMLERAITVSLTVLTGALILGGLFLPFLTTDDPEDDDLPLFLISAPFQALGYRDEDGSADQASTLMGSALLLLLLVVGSALLTLFAVVERSAGRWVAGWAMGTAVLLVCGTIGLWALIGMGLSDDDAAVGPGALLLSAGAIVFALLVVPDRVRGWWSER